jgi:copper chaperone
LIRNTAGVTKYEVSLENQTADVYTESLDYDTVLKTIAKTGKKVTSGEADGKEAPVEPVKAEAEPAKLVAPAKPEGEPAIVTGAE